MDDWDDHDPDFDFNAPIVVPIDGTLDLHTFRPDEVADVLREYFRAAREEGINEVRVIHGKGSGRLKAGVLVFLEKSGDVASHVPAPPERGGWGATIVYLKPA
jgi:DNA-nicking Smr family endonuclease